MFTILMNKKMNITCEDVLQVFSVYIKLHVMLLSANN